MYVANVSSGCFKYRSGVAHVAMTPMAGGQRPAGYRRLQFLPRVARFALSSPLPLLPSLLSISPRQFELARETEGCRRPRVWAGGVGRTSRPGSVESSSGRGTQHGAGAGNAEQPRASGRRRLSRRPGISTPVRKKKYVIYLVLHCYCQ